MIRVAISPTILSTFMENNRELAVPIQTAYILVSPVAFMELDDYQHMNFLSDLLELVPAYRKSVIPINLEDGTKVVSWYFDIEENK